MNEVRRCRTQYCAIIRFNNIIFSEVYKVQRKIKWAMGQNIGWILKPEKEICYNIYVL